MCRKGGINFYTQTILSTGLFLILMLGMGTGSLQAQSFDYEFYPKLDFDFISLELDLGLQPQNLRIDGAATYQIQANVSEADTVILYAAHMDISNVTVDGNDADFMLSNDSLFVPLSEPSEAGQEYELSVRYSGNPKFGLLKNVNGTVTTSYLPKSQRHWAPIVDNPHVEFETTFNIAVPSGYQVWATGQKTGEETVSVDVMRYNFQSQGKVPASSIAFAVGRFDRETVSVGGKQINLVTEQALTDTVDEQQLLQKAGEFLEQTGQQLQMDYPYDQLTIFVLDDHQWETKSWGASAVNIYQNRGSLESQLLRGIVGQWFGVYHREMQWSQADAISLQQALVHQAMADSNILVKEADTLETNFSTIYDEFGIKSWNSWIEKWDSWQDEPIKNVIKNTQPGVLTELSSVVRWDDYAKYWYRQSGQPLFEMPEIKMAERMGESLSPEEEAEDSVAYEVTYDLNEQEGQLTLSFEALYGVYEELISLNAYEIYSSRTDTSEVTFTGSSDSIVLQVDPMISTLRLDTTERPGLYLDEYKPASFLLYELRNSESVVQRAEAARKLGVHTENPDLQLAINDFMGRDLEPEVEAALLSSYADITNGATGTETEFLAALESENVHIRNAGLMALQNYRGNAQVRSRVAQLAESTDSYDFYKKATQVLTAISSPDQFTSFVGTITQQDTVGEKSIFAIQELANMGEVEEAVENAELFTEDQYSFNIRSRALNILIQHDHTPSDWLSRAESMLETSDPRIRFLVIRGLERIENQEIRDFLSEYAQDEYDARVHQKIEQVLN